MAALPPLVVPRRSPGTVRSGEKGGVKEDVPTDGERSIVTRTTQLLQVCVTGDTRVVLWGDKSK